MARTKIKHRDVFWWIMLSIVLFSMVATPLILLISLAFGKNVAV